jgi:hypothetical protein
MESLIGWEVETVTGFRQVYSRCANPDTDNDGLTDIEESGAGIDCNADGIVDVTWITDPSSRDTDGDGVEDIDEACGFDVTLRSTGTTIVVQTDPTNHDTDSDTASDGVERRLGGDPTDPSDIDQFADADGDGLVNYQETDGWQISVSGVSVEPAVCISECSQPVAATVHVTSDPYLPDTDGDGMPDGVEKTVDTNPGLRDTDNDGLTDFEEVYGFFMRDAGIIVLDPADADTDNDKRSDGDEAELSDSVATRWIVRIPGETPYRVYSDPRYSDADFDTLVDGDEHGVGSDPWVANTDGDRRDDAMEVVLALNPLEPDFRVTVFLRALEVDQPGEYNWLYCPLNNTSQCGDAEASFRFFVRRPDDSTATGLEATPTRVAGDWDFRTFMPACIDNSFIDPWHHQNNPCVSVADDGIQMGGGDVLEFFHSDYAIPENMRSISFSVTENQRFSVEGQVGEFDVNPTTYHWHYFGGLDGTPASQNANEMLAVFEGADVIKKTIEHYSFEYDHPNWNSQLNPPASPASGRIRFSYVVE